MKSERFCGRTTIHSGSGRPTHWIVLPRTGNRWNEFCSLLGQFAETLSGDSIMGHYNAYTIEEVSDDSGGHEQPV